ncbi:Rpd3L histone deacetylase complex subunit DEP1 NDAI_0H02420 [Naumovozyma dairenensis CBS 421]|uniref:Transcriptional regulatory protein DEP1 n=1 Tax=Naumovozyma dairenensis (strain ATCC 10597 / BCRC 20456 / CBS 421 / NBRC 0211 / NRRL Y-12639) TaxID=1071378 RepID=G0WF55_NAUDC|nr:hypothetical protein NDAI_0H02420 [Naumovozyma dairenensis CBS 421]CCD26416.1 hypothetical protein NDAI_0H02420 [Naumovozyma dairenensis CBS 421]
MDRGEQQNDTNNTYSNNATPTLPTATHELSLSSSKPSIEINNSNAATTTTINTAENGSNVKKLEDDEESALSNIDFNNQELNNLNLSEYCISSDADTEKMGSDILQEIDETHPRLIQLVNNNNNNNSNDATIKNNNDNDDDNNPALMSNINTATLQNEPIGITSVIPEQQQQQQDNHPQLKNNNSNSNSSAELLLNGEGPRLPLTTTTITLKHKTENESAEDEQEQNKKIKLDNSVATTDVNQPTNSISDEQTIAQSTATNESITKGIDNDKITDVPATQINNKINNNNKNNDNTNDVDDDEDGNEVGDEEEDEIDIEENLTPEEERPGLLKSIVSEKADTDTLPTNTNETIKNDLTGKIEANVNDESIKLDEVENASNEEEEADDDEEEAEDEDEEDEEEVEVPEEGKDKRLAEIDHEEQRLNALKEITDIEYKFAELRQKLYENKLLKLETELQMCLEGSHPELQSYYQKIAAIRDYKLRKAYQRQKYELQCIDRETRATRTFIHQDHYKKVNDIRNKLLNDTTETWYDINRERRDLDVMVPDVSYHVPIKTAEKTLSCITGYAGPAQLKLPGEALSEDLACEGVNFRYKGNPVDKLEVIVDRMRLNNEISDLEGIKNILMHFLVLQI